MHGNPSPPLAGLRIIAVEQYGAGPWGSMMLADLGAEVIKIETPHDGGDMSRGVGPFFFEGRDSEFFQAFNRNKRSVALDLRRPEGQAVFHDLVRTADAVADNLRGDVPARLGVTYAALAAVNPRIVCAHLSAYGRSGSRADWPGFDYLMQAEAGYFSLTGEPDAPPSRFGLSIVDFGTGVASAMALLAGIVSARASGVGRDIDTSLFDLGLSNLNYLATWYLNDGFVQGREPRSGHPTLGPCQLFRTADGWIFIMCNKEKFWPILAAELGRPEWGSDPDFASFAARKRNRERMAEMVEAELVKRDTAHWLAAFAGKVPCAPVYDVRQALENPFLAERGRIVEVEHHVQGRIRMLACPIQWQGEPVAHRACGPLGADTDAVLGAIGYDAGRIAGLRAAGVLGPAPAPATAAPAE